MRFYSDDPVADAKHRDDAYEEWLEERPVCDWCGEHIAGDYCYEIDNATVCPECIADSKKYID